MFTRTNPIMICKEEEHVGALANPAKGMMKLRAPILAVSQKGLKGIQRTSFNFTEDLGDALFP